MQVKGNLGKRCRVMGPAMIAALLCVVSHGVVLAQDNVVPATANAGAVPATGAGEFKPDHSFWLYDGEQKIRLLETRATIGAKGGILTAYGASVHAYAIFSDEGPSSPTRSTNRMPSFGDVMVPDSRRVGEAVQLVKLEVEKGHRQIQVGKSGAFSGAQTGIPDAARIPLVFDEGRAVTYAGRTFMIYKFKPASALAPGEYAVVMGGSHYLDFGID
jgi:hypothetical protein